MSMTNQEFDPRNWPAQRRARLQRIAAAAVQQPWPASEKAAAKAPAPATAPVPPAPIPAQEVLEPPRKSEFWFRVLDDDEPKDTEFRPTIREIQIAVARVYGLESVDLRSARRIASIVRPRQIAMYLAKKLTARSLPEIGRYFGGRDHTTIIHAVRKIERLIEADASVAGEVAAFTERLGANTVRAA